MDSPVPSEDLEQPDGTVIARDFTMLRMQTNRVLILLLERLPLVGPEAVGHCTVDPLQALCRAMRLAPPGYRCFEWTAAKQGAPLHVQADVVVDSWEIRLC